MTESTRNRLTRGAIATVIVALAAAWIYVFAVAGQADPHNTIRDEAFPLAAQQECAAVIARIDRLPTPRETPTAAARSEVVAEATDLLAPMVMKLRELAPSPDDPEDGWVHDWLDDWEYYLEDRYAYAEALIDDPDARFLITVRNDRDRLTRDLDQVAVANQMPDCATPKDV